MNKLFGLILLVFVACKTDTNTSGTLNKDSAKQVSHLAADNGRFNGDWEYEEKRDGSIISTFQLRLQTKGNIISGSYCSVYQSGNKIDCAEDPASATIAGTIKNDTAFVTLKGNYDKQATGMAKLYSKNKGLMWALTTSEGNIYVPKKALLKKGTMASKATAATGILPINGSKINSMPFKEVKEQIIGLDDFYCGMHPQAYQCPMVGKFEVRIISNECGDYPFYSLVTTFRGRYVDKKLIYMQEWANLEDESEKSTTDFVINNEYKISVTEKHTINGRTTKTLSGYRIDEKSGMINAL